MKGCGYEPSDGDYKRLFSAVCWSAQYGHGSLDDCKRALSLVEMAGGTMGVDEYWGLLEACAWYSQLHAKQALEQGGDDSWSGAFWGEVVKILEDMEEGKMELGNWGVTLCARIAKYAYLPADFHVFFTLIPTPFPDPIHTYMY